MSDERPVAVVTGASSGIGAATAERLAADGWAVVAAARRTERIETLARRIGGRAVTCDVTDPASVEALCAEVPQCAVLVNNAGGAWGTESIEDADDQHWRWMYEVNVAGTVRVTRALLPAMTAHGEGHVVMIGSIAGIEAYPGGAGYNAAKFGVRAFTQVLRKELLGRPIGVTEIDPGLVETEFSLVRFDGDATRAAGVYEGIDPLQAGDIADCVAWAVTRPSRVNVDQMVVLARDQAGATTVHRNR